MRATRHRGELFRHELGWLVGGLVLPYETHARDQAPQLVGGALRNGCGAIFGGQQQPRAPGKIPDGNVGAGRLAGDMGPPIYGRELHEGGASLAGGRLQGATARDFEVALLETHDPARPGPV